MYLHQEPPAAAAGERHDASQTQRQEQLGGGERGSVSVVRSGHCDDGGCDGRSVHHEEDGHPRPPHWHAGLQTVAVQGQGCESLNI